jgi:hypothetical protein
LAELRDPRIQANEEIIQKSLVGNWQPAHVFVLEQSRLLYQSYQPINGVSLGTLNKQVVSIVRHEQRNAGGWGSPGG